MMTIEDQFPKGSHVVVTHVEPKPKVPIIGIVEGYFAYDCLKVRCVNGARAGGRWPHMLPHREHVRKAEWCDFGNHWGPGVAHGDYICVICRKDVDDR